jgi:putative ABC transport system permease protein
MGRTILVCRLVGRDLRRRPVQAMLMLLAVTAATAILTLGLALHGVTSQPYQQTRAATKGPDVVAYLGAPSGRSVTGRKLQAEVRAQAGELVRDSGVSGSSGPYPLAGALVRAHGRTAGAEAEGRGGSPAAVDQPKLTAGTWVRPGGVVLERTFAEALGVGVGDRITLNGRPFTVAGIAVTAANPPYPNLCYTGGGGCYAGPDVPAEDMGLLWLTEPDALGLATPANPVTTYALNLKLADPAEAEAFTSRYGSNNNNPPFLTAWQGISAADGLVVKDEQAVLNPGAWIAGLLALASVAVLAGGRMAERSRRVGLLKAAGGSPGLVAAVLMAENLVLGLAAAGAGLAIGWLAAPLLINPGAALLGTPGAPSLTVPDAGLVVAVSLAVSFVATLVPAIRAARTSTVSALADAARTPRRRAALIAISGRLPVAPLLGLRLIARRPRRALLGAANIAVTVAGIVAVLTFHATVDQTINGGGSGLSNPVFNRDEQVLTVLTVALLVLASLNAIFTTWATAMDSRQSSALARALGATPRQVGSALLMTQLLPALPGSLAGVPMGIGLVLATDGGGAFTIPPAWWLAAAVAGTLVAVAVLTAVPARIGARRPVVAILEAETA